MKKTTLLVVLLCTNAWISNAQYNTPWTTNTSNSTNTGYIGIGIKPTIGSTTLANFNFQVHGTADFIVNDDRGGGGASINYGKTARLGLTNSTCGGTFSDGGVLRMSGNNFSITNQENGNLTLGVPNLFLNFDYSTNRIWIGSSAYPTTDYAKFNIVTGSDDGLLIKTVSSDKTALKIKSYNDNSSSIEVFGSGTSEPNFKVFGSGTIYARKYVTTLNNFPDYVFMPSYELMPLEELRNFIHNNRHLPNMPTAEQVEQEGADVGEINRLLVEKVEELTLYILQLEERINVIEEQNVKVEE